MREDFFHDKIYKILTESKSVIDIGGGLRATPGRGNRLDPSRSWATSYINKIEYKVLDPIDTYNPDIVGDIHDLPFEDNSQEAIICMAVLEHVENPIKACEELYRVLKPGGYCFVYVPFLYYYHAHEGYYQDYWRFTKDALKTLFKKFKTFEAQPVHGAIETWIKLGPFGKYKLLRKLAHKLDVWLGKDKSYQTSGYNIFLIK